MSDDEIKDRTLRSTTGKLERLRSQQLRGEPFTEEQHEWLVQLTNQIHEIARAFGRLGAAADAARASAERVRRKETSRTNGQI